MERYLTDEADNRTGVVLSVEEFEVLAEAAGDTRTVHQVREAVERGSR